MTKITPKQAKVFLNSISKKDKVAVLHDGDLDGYASGVLFYSFAKNQGAKVKNFVSWREMSPTNFLPKLKRFNKIIITDLGPNTIIDILRGLKDKQVFYTDHHPPSEKIPDNILELRTHGQGYIPSSRTAFELTELDEWKAVAGTISDMGHKYKENDKFLKPFLKKEKITLERFLKDVVFTINKLILYYYKKPKKAFYILARLKTYRDLHKIKKITRKVEDEIQKHIKLFSKNHERFGKVKFYKFDPHYPIKSSVTTALSFKHKKSAIILYLKKKDQIKISARTQAENVKLNELLMECTKDFPGAKAGGHDRASGAVFHKKHLKQFKKNLKEYAKKLK